MDLIELVKEKVKKYDLKKSRSVIAVSGGSDSMALLHLMSGVLDERSLCVAHVNHGTRKENDWEESLVKESAQSLGLDFFSTKLSFDKFSEELARKKRYNYLKKVAQKTHSRYIILAHHADDQLETILLKLARGTGPLDLWGMDEFDDPFLRPLLEVSKNELVSYCKSQKIPYLIDPSNKDISFARNRIRLKIVPQLKKINPSLLKTIVKQKSVYGELSDYIKKEVNRIILNSFKEESLDLRTFLNLPPFLQKVILKEIIKQKLPQKELSQKNLTEILKIAQAEGNKKTKIAHLWVKKSYDKLIFCASEEDAKPPREFNLSEGEVINFGAFTLKLKKGLARARKNVILLPDELVYNLKVRAWKDGDRVNIKSGSKKLQDVFVDAKIPQDERKRWPVVISNNEVVWIPFLAAHQKALNETQNKVWYIEAQYEKAKQ